MSQGQTIYPLDRAEILSGSRFDFKVEFPGAPAQDQVKVTINGQDPAALFGRPASFVQREDSKAIAYGIRTIGHHIDANCCPDMAAERKG